MTGRIRIVLFSHSADGFAIAQSACEAAGHEPIAYVYARASRPGRGSGPGASAAVAGIVESLPAGVDLLLPRSAASLARSLPGYRPDLLLCNGFPRRIPRRVLDAARLGGIKSIRPCCRATAAPSPSIGRSGPGIARPGSPSTGWTRNSTPGG